MIPIVSNEQQSKEYYRGLKEEFGNRIRGTFLIAVLDKANNREEITGLIQFFYKKYCGNVFMLSAIVDRLEHLICRVIIGAHHANTIFLTQEECSHKEKNLEYKESLVNQVVNMVSVPYHLQDFLRNHSFIVNCDGYGYYPAPYYLNVLCLKICELFANKKKLDYKTRLYAALTNNAIAALMLLDSGILDSAYMPCRRVIEMYAKIALLEKQPHLIESYKIFEQYAIDRMCYQKYGEKLNCCYKQKKGKGTKPEYMHYGFVDTIEDYHDVVKMQPYTLNGIITYLLKDSSGGLKKSYRQLAIYYKVCNEYSHGNSIKSPYFILHYFELMMILGEIIPRVYEMYCNENQVPLVFAKTDILKCFEQEYALLKEQYDKKSTELLNIEREKYLKIK